MIAFEDEFVTTERYRKRVAGTNPRSEAQPGSISALPLGDG